MYGSHPGKSDGQYGGPPELYGEGGLGNLLKIVAAVPYRGDTIIVFDNTHEKRPNYNERICGTFE